MWLRRARSTALLLALALALVASGPAAALAADDEPQGDPAEARQQYNAGTQAFAAKRYLEAALHFEAAAAHRPHPIALYTAALAWEQAGKPDRAADDFGRALEAPGLGAKEKENAKERLAALERTLGTVVVAGPDGHRVAV